MWKEAFQGAIPAFAWRTLRNTTKNLRIAGVRTEV
jgi:hypothetical protein